MDFALNSDPSKSEIADAINYLLANIGSNTLIYNATTGQITSGNVVIGYLYRYLWVKYATSFNGDTGFSNSPTNATYYGLHNSNSSTESTNPSDYVWTQATFSTTNFLWYLATGGRKVTIDITTVAPSTGWTVDSGSAIDLDSVSGAASTRPLAYGELAILNNAVGTVCVAQNTFYQVTTSWVAQDALNYTQGASSLTSTLGGAAYTVCSMSIITTTGAQVYNIQIFKNGSPIAGHNGTIRLANSNDVNSITVSGLIGSVAAGDTFDVRIQNTTSAGQTVTVQWANFVMFNI